ncbi:hypothetical protein [Escherichia coli]
MDDEQFDEINIVYPIDGSGFEMNGWHCDNQLRDQTSLGPLAQW